MRAPQPLGAALPANITNKFIDAFSTSPVEAERLTSELLTPGRPSPNRLLETGELVHWASASGTPEQRRALMLGFRKSAADLTLIHHVARLPREQTAKFIKEYLDDGGALEPVLQWLSIAGGVLRSPPGASPPGRRSVRARSGGRAARGPFSWLDDVVHAVENLGHDILDAVDSLVDAVVDAGKSVADAIGAAASWSIAKVTDLVESLIRAGKRTAEILSAAAAKGAEQLKRYVEAVLAAGRALGEVLSWAAGQVATTLNTVVQKTLQLGRSLTDVLESAIALGRSVLIAVTKALLAGGKTLRELLGSLARGGVAVFRPLVDALLASGRALGDLLVEAALLPIATCRTIVAALMDLGKTVASVLAEAAARAASTLRVIAQALLDLGKSLTNLVVSAAGLAAGAVKAVLQALLAMGHSLAELVAAAVGQTLSVVKATFTALLALGRKVADILVALGGRAVSALRTALEALLAMGVSLVSLVKDILTGVAEEFRRGFFEGLLALGKTPLQLLQAAAETSVSLLLLAFGVVLELFGGYRKLSKVEKDEAKKVFGTAIELDRVKLGFARLPGAVIEYVNKEIPRAFTTLYLLNFGPGAEVDMQTIIHELAHVWQGVQDGPLYMTRALEAQIGAGVASLFHTGKYDDSAAYTVTEAALAANGGDLDKFNPEQQATIVEFFWIQRFSARVQEGGFPWKVNSGVVVPSLNALLPYAQKVNPSLRARRPVSAHRKAAAA